MSRFLESPGRYFRERCIDSVVNLWRGSSRVACTQCRQVSDLCQFRSCTCASVGVTLLPVSHSQSHGALINTNSTVLISPGESSPGNPRFHHSATNGRVHRDWFRFAYVLKRSCQQLSLSSKHSPAPGRPPKACGSTVGDDVE